jgi:hypothetical protein
VQRHRAKQRNATLTCFDSRSRFFYAHSGPRPVRLRFSVANCGGRRSLYVSRQMMMWQNRSQEHCSFQFSALTRSTETTAAFALGAVAVFGRSCLPGRTSRLAATYVHISQSSRPISRRLLHTKFALRRKSFPADSPLPTLLVEEQSHCGGVPEESTARNAAIQPGTGSTTKPGVAALRRTPGKKMEISPNPKRGSTTCDARTKNSHL